MKVLIVDNKDSFTYNLKHYVDIFCDNVDVLRYDKINVNDVEFYDKILFSPGPGLPKEYKILEKILSKYEKNKSILGVCLGHQSIAEYYGCVLENISEPMHGIKSRVTHLGNCVLFKNIPNNFLVGHYHSWIVSNKNKSSDLEVTSYNNHGYIMSLKHKKFDIKAVQFHPESILTQFGLNLIENWINN